MLTNQDSDVDIQLRPAQSLKPCELQKLIPNHQSSFCWICLPLLTLSIIRSSWSSHHWESTSLVWILSHWSVFQGGLGRGGIHRTSDHRGSSGIGSWTPLLHVHYITGSHHTSTWLLLPFLRWWHTALSLISTRWSNGSCTDLRLISAWMKEHDLQLNLAKTELLVFPATATLQHDFTIQLGSSTITPSSSVRNLGVIFDDQLTYKDHIAKTIRPLLAKPKMTTPYNGSNTHYIIILRKKQWQGNKDISLDGAKIEVVSSYKCLGIWLDIVMSWVCFSVSLSVTLCCTDTHTHTHTHAYIHLLSPPPVCHHNQHSRCFAVTPVLTLI